MSLLINCNIKGLIALYETLGSFINDLEHLFKKISY